MKTLIKYSCLVYFILLGFNLFAADISSTGTGGAWNVASTWSGGVVPVAADNVTIISGSTVTLNTTQNCVNLIIESTGVLSVDLPAATTFTVNGTTSISGSLNTTTTLGTKIFIGLITINSSGEWNSSVAANFTLRGGLQNDGLFTSGGGTYTFTTNPQSLSGAELITFNGSVIITLITVTNNNTNASGLSILGNLTGTGTIVNPANGILTLQGSVTITGFTATAIPNYVTYNRSGNQTIKGTTYHNITISGSGTKTSGAALTVNKDLTLSGTAYLADGGFQITGRDTGKFTMGAGTGLTIGNTTAATLFPSNFVSDSISLNLTSVVTYYSNLAQTISSTPFSYGNLTISSAGGTPTKTLNGNIIVNGNFTISVNNTFADAGDTVNCKNTITVNGTHTGTGQVLLSGATNNQSITGTGSLTNVTIAKTSGIIGRITSGFTINGNLFVTSGKFTLNGFTLTTGGNINIAEGSTLTVNANAKLKVTNGKIITNYGIFSVVGTNGSIASITNTGSGFFNILQNSPLADFGANYYLFEYCNLTISDGIVNGTNNFSNGTFSNGSGNQYMNLDGLASSFSPTFITFNSGPSFNIHKTTGAGVVNISTSYGALAGESNDEDNGNPGSLILWTISGNTFYSQGTGSFSTLTNWDTNTGGGGSDPIATDLTSGFSTFIIQNGHTITVNQNISVLDLKVGTGTSGALTIGNSTTARTVTVRDTLIIENGGTINVGSFASAHALYLYGEMINNGYFDMYTAAGQVANVYFYRTGAQSITGTPSLTQFNSITFGSGTTTTTDLPIDIKGNLGINASSTFYSGAFTHTIFGNWTCSNTGGHNSTGTILFNGVAQTISGPTSFYNVELSGSGTKSLGTNTVTVSNNFNITANNLLISAGTTINITGNLTISGTPTIWGGGANTTNVTGNFIVTNNSALTIGNSTSVKTINVTGDYQVDAGSSVNIGAFAATHILNIAGNLIANGDFNMYNAASQLCNVTFSGSSNKSISGTGSTCNFNTITINKGTSNVLVLDVTRVITQQVPSTLANYLTISNGTFKLSSASALAPYFGAVTISSATGKLWINNPGATIGSNGVAATAYTYTLTGALQISSGTLNIGSGNDNFAPNSATSILTVDGGTLNINGSLTFSSTSQFNMTSGNINVDAQATDNLAAGTTMVWFSSTHPTNAVNFTGGTITLIDPQNVSNTAGRAIYVPPTAGIGINFNGSTIQFGDGSSNSSGVAADGFEIDAGNQYALGNIILNNGTSSGTNRYVRLLNTHCIIGGNLTIGTNANDDFRLNGRTLTLKGNLINNGLFTSVTSTSVLSLSGTTQQTISGSGNFNDGTAGRILALTINNSSGTTPSVDLQKNIAIATTGSALTLTSGSLGTTNGSTLNFGANTATTITVTRTNGSLTIIPAWNLTSVTYNLTYNTAAGQITTGNELPTTTSGNIGTLTINNGTGVLLNNADITVNNALTLTSGTLNIQDYTFRYNGGNPTGAGTFTLGPLSTLVFGTNAAVVQLPNNFFTTSPSECLNLTINRAGGVRLGNQGLTLNGTLTLTSGTLSLYANTLTFQDANTPIVRTGGSITTAANSSITFGTTGHTAGTAFQIPSSTFASSPTILNIFTVNRDNKLTLGNQALSLSGSLILTKGEFDNNSQTLTTSANVPFVKTAGTLTVGLTGSLVFNANATAFTVPDNLFTTAPATFTGLTMNRGAGILATLGNQEINITGTTTLTAGTGGILVIKNSDLQIANVGGTPSATSMIIMNGTGLIKKYFPVGASAAFTFPIGENTGTTEYSPARLTFATNATAGLVSVKVTNLKHPSNTQTDNYLNRYWSFYAPTLTTYTYSSGYTYNAADVTGTDEVGFIAERYDLGTSSWNPDLASSTNTTTHVLTEFGPLTEITGKLHNNEFTSFSIDQYYWAKASGTWNGAAVWETTTGNTDPGVGLGTATLTVPTHNNNKGITIRNNVTVTLNAATYTADQLTISSGSTLALGTNNFTVYNGSGNDLTLASGGSLTTTTGLILSNTSGINYILNGTLTTTNIGGLSIDGTSTIPTTNSPTITLGTTSILNFNGAAGQKIDSRSDYGYLQVTAAGQKNAQGTITVNKDLTITTATLADAGFTINVKGNITNNGIHSGAGLLSINTGTALHSITGGSNSFGNIEINDNPYATTFTGTGATAVTGTLAVTSGTLNIGSFTSSLAISGNTTLSGLLNITSATGTKTFGNITVNSSGSFSNSGNSNVTISGNLQQDGTLTPGTGTVTFSGLNKTISGTKNFLNMNGSITGTYRDTCLLVPTFYNLSIGVGAQLKVAVDCGLTIANSFTNSGTIGVNAGPGGHSGSLITPASITNTGTCSFTTSIAKNVWHGLSSPVTNAQIETVFSDLASNNNNFYYYDETNASVYWVQDTIGTMTPGKGFYVYYFGNKYKTYSGTYNSGAISVGLTYSAGGRKGWNFVGNPYPSAIDWDTTGWVKTNIDSAVYVRNGPAWESYNRGIGNCRYIYPGQGFFVVAKSGGGTLGFSNSTRIHRTADHLKSTEGVTTVTDPILNMEVTNNSNYSNNTFIRLSSNATTAFNSSWDARKFFSEVQNYPEIFTVSSGNDTLTINSTPFNGLDTIIPLGIKIGLAGNYSIKAKEFLNIPLDVEVFLVDANSNNWTDLRLNPNYNFYSELSKNATRFSIHFTRNPLAIATVPVNNNLQITEPYCFNNQLNFIVNNASEKEIQIELFDITGRSIYNQNLEINSNSQSVSLGYGTLPAGYYLLKVQNQKETVVKKVCLIK